MSQTSSFFELAALLLPLLMLSGYVTTRLRPPRVLEIIAAKRGWQSLLLAVAVVIAFGYFPVIAELLALNAVMAGEPPGALDTWIVALAVAFGTYSVALAWLWPWIRLPWVYAGGRVRVVLAVSSVGLIVASALLLRSGVELQHGRSLLAENAGTSTAGDPFYVMAGDLVDMNLRSLDAQRREGTISKRAYLKAHVKYERLWTQLIFDELRASAVERRQALERLDLLP